jgi:hypothetical protein
VAAAWQPSAVASLRRHRTRTGARLMVQDYDAGEMFRPLGTRTDTGTLFGQTIEGGGGHRRPVHAGRLPRPHLSGGSAMAFWIASLLCLLAMNVAVRQSEQLTLGLLFGFGLLVGLATAPTISYYANVDPEAAWEAGGATGAVRRRHRCRRLCDATRPLLPHAVRSQAPLTAKTKMASSRCCWGTINELGSTHRARVSCGRRVRAPRPRAPVGGSWSWRPGHRGVRRR